MLTQKKGRLAGKTAFVTGGSKGLGAAIVELFAEEGADVVFGARGDEVGFALEAQLRVKGLNVAYTHLDVANADNWTQAIDFALATYGKLDILVNNAAINSGDGLDVSLDEWQNVLNANLTGQLLGMKAAMPALQAAGKQSTIVNVASLYAIIGSPSNLAYHASKGGVRSMTKSAALEYAQQGVRINGLFPGMIDTEFGGDEVSEETLQEILKVIPIGRKSSPREIAYGALFLASEESSYMIGAELVMDGGWSVP